LSNFLLNKIIGQSFFLLKGLHRVALKTITLNNHTIDIDTETTGRD